MIRQITPTLSPCERSISEPCYFSCDGHIRRICTRKPHERCFRSADDRFHVRNTWHVDNHREPNWVLVDHVTGHSYSFFLRVQAEHKMAMILIEVDPFRPVNADTG